MTTGDLTLGAAVSGVIAFKKVPLSYDPSDLRSCEFSCLIIGSPRRKPKPEHVIARRLLVATTGLNPIHC